MQGKFHGSFGDFLAMKRGQAGLSIKDVARWLHIGSSYYNSLESGEHKAPEQLLLDRLAVILELSPADRLQLYDLAARTHRYIAADLPKYISQYPYVLAALVKAQQGQHGEASQLYPAVILSTAYAAQFIISRLRAVLG